MPKRFIDLLKPVFAPVAKRRRAKTATRSIAFDGGDAAVTMGHWTCFEARAGTDASANGTAIPAGVSQLGNRDGIHGDARDDDTKSFSNTTWWS